MDSRAKLRPTIPCSSSDNQCSRVEITWAVCVYRLVITICSSCVTVMSNIHWTSTKHPQNIQWTSNERSTTLVRDDRDQIKNIHCDLWFPLFSTAFLLFLIRFTWESFEHIMFRTCIQNQSFVLKAFLILFRYFQFRTIVKSKIPLAKQFTAYNNM